MEIIRTIALEKRVKLDQVAAEGGVTGGHLRRLINKNTFASASLWRFLIAWSGGRITPNTFFEDEIKAAKAGADVPSVTDRAA